MTKLILLAEPVPNHRIKGIYQLIHNASLKRPAEVVVNKVFFKIGRIYANTYRRKDNLGRIKEHFSSGVKEFLARSKHHVSLPRLMK
jgi:hypothetical protein